MKKILFINLFLVSFLTYSQSNPFDTLKFDKVIAYEYEQEIGDDFDFKMNINKKVTLTEKQIDTLETILTSKDSYGNDIMSCFNPHFAVFYYQQEKIVASIKVCLECNYLKSSEKIPATELKMIKISDDHYPAKGFSKKTRKEIYEYIKGIGFTKYLRPLTSYLDE